MADGYFKAHSVMLDSSIWDEPDHVLRVWWTLCLMANRDGVVEASVGGLARRAHKSRTETLEALATFMGPDPDSRDGTTGERLEKIRGGWRILNYEGYRDRASKEDQRAKATERKRRQRAREKAQETRSKTPVSRDVTPPSRQSRQAEADTEADTEAKEDLTGASVITKTSTQARARRGEAAARARAGTRGSSKPADRARGLLVNGYQARYEEHIGDMWQSATPNRGHIQTVADWAVSQSDLTGEPLDAVIGRWLDAVWANDYLRARRCPWGLLARDPARDLASGGDRALERLLGAWNEAADKLLENDSPENQNACKEAKRVYEAARARIEGGATDTGADGSPPQSAGSDVPNGGADARAKAFFEGT